MITLQKKIKKNIIQTGQKVLTIYRILIIGGSGSQKTNALLNLINHEPDIDKTYLYTKGPYEAKYQLLFKKEKVYPKSIS